jgi:plastocyanin
MTMITMTKRVGVVGVGLAAILGLGACGSDESEPKAKDAGRITEDAGPSGNLRIEAGEFSLAPANLKAAPGTLAVEYVNVGAIAHTLVIDGVSGLKLEVTSAGDIDKGTIKLEPGTYTLYCDVPGHRQAGMAAPLTIG